MASFTCLVCFENKDSRLPLGQLTTLNGDIFREKDCEHPVCEACMAAFVIARVEEQLVFGIRCPFEGCKQQIYEKDVQTLVEKGSVSLAILEQMTKLRHQSYEDRVSDLMESEVVSSDDAEFLKTLWATTRCCPSCGVIIQKSAGCDSFGCICGHHFNYAQAPRGCGEGIHNFDNVTHLAAEHKMCVKRAMSLVQEGGKRGIQDFDLVIDFAAQHSLSLQETMCFVEEGLKKGISDFGPITDFVVHYRLSLQESMSFVEEGLKKGIVDFDPIHIVARNSMSLQDSMSFVEEGLKRGIIDFAPIEGLVAHHGFSLQDAMSIVEDGMRHGIIGYGAVLAQSERLHAPLKLAEAVVQAHLGQDVGIEQLRQTKCKPKLRRKVEKAVQKARHLRCLSLGMA